MKAGPSRESLAVSPGPGANDAANAIADKCDGEGGVGGGPGGEAAARESRRVAMLCAPLCSRRDRLLSR